MYLSVKFRQPKIYEEQFVYILKSLAHSDRKYLFFMAELRLTDYKLTRVENNTYL